MIKYLGDSKWQARTTVISDGVKKRATKVFYAASSQQNKQAALDWLDYWQRVRAGMAPFFSQPTTLGELVDYYLESVQGAVKSITLESYRRLLSRPLSHFGPAHFLNFTQWEINEYVRKRQNDGAGRGIIKELGALRQGLSEVSVAPIWEIPRKLYCIPKRVRNVCPTGIWHEIMDSAVSPVSIASALSLFVGLRSHEVFRVTWDMHDRNNDLFIIPGEIRKNKIGNVVPVVETLKKQFDPEIAGGLTPSTAGIHTPIIDVSKSVVTAELRRLSNGEIRGLQPFRRLLVSTALDCGYDHDSIALVTGHARQSMPSRYSDSMGQLELKRKILEDVERRLTWEGKAETRERVTS